jgi:hypothetical protein
MERKKFIQLTLSASALWLLRPFISAAGNLELADVNVAYYRKGAPEYELLRKGFNKRINNYPLVVAQCFNTNGVAEAVKLARKNNWPVTIKSGGHCMEGFSTGKEGMTIDLSSMNEVKSLGDEKVTIGPACKLSELYAYLLPKGLIIPGGSCAGVAISGLTLGGGYGLMSRKFGLTCDSLEGVTMVDGQGQVIDSNEDPELLWACKGGNNGNFGVVTQLRFRTHKAPATMKSYKFRSYKVNRNRAKNILQTWFNLSKTLPNDCFSAFVQNHTTTYILLTQTATSNNEAVDAFINGLKKLSDKSTERTRQPLQQALKNYYGRTYPMYFKNASAGLYKDYNQISFFIGDVLDLVLQTPGLIYQVNTLGGKIQQQSFENGSAFPHRGFSYFSELQTYWEHPKQASRLKTQFEKIQKVVKNAGVTEQYRNYPDINFDNPMTSYYGKNLKRLQAVKKSFDPDHIFRHPQSI